MISGDEITNKSDNNMPVDKTGSDIPLPPIDMNEINESIGIKVPNDIENNNDIGIPRVEIEPITDLNSIDNNSLNNDSTVLGNNANVGVNDIVNTGVGVDNNTSGAADINTSVDAGINENINTSDNSNVDYKELYETLKEDNEATNILLEQMALELSQYKEKYGEL